MNELEVRVPKGVSEWGDRKLDNAIKRGHAAAGAHMANYEAAATLTGVLLRERKRRLAHGEWGKWLSENFVGSHQTATAYMRMADARVPQIESPLSFSAPVEATDEDGQAVDAEVVEEEEGQPTRREIVHRPIQYLPDLLDEDAPTNLRTQVVRWCELGRHIEALLNEQTQLEPKDSDDLRLIKDEVEVMVEVARRIRRIK